MIKLSDRPGDKLKEERVLVMMPAELLTIDKDVQAEMINGFVGCLEKMMDEEMGAEARAKLSDVNSLVFENIPQFMIENKLPEDLLIGEVASRCEKLRRDYRIKCLIVCLSGIQPKKLSTSQEDLLKLSDRWMKEKFKRIRDKLKQALGLEETIFVYYKLKSFQEMMAHLCDRNHVLKIKDTVIVT